jgi:hypothetical protein
MKIIKPLLLPLFVAITLFSCNAQKPADQKTEDQKSETVISEDLQVFYFHNTKRCATCNAVEDETKVALQMFYEDNMKEGTMNFTSLNLEEEDGEKMAQSLQVSGQTLLIVKGKTRVNLTNEGFMNARTNPTKFHEILKTQIDELL